MNEFMEMLCKEDLSKLRYYERRIAEIPDEIAEEQARLTSIKSSTAGTGRREQARGMACISSRPDRPAKG